MDDTTNIPATDPATTVTDAPVVEEEEATEEVAPVAPATEEAVA
jgi:hypothetical protein